MGEAELFKLLPDGVSVISVIVIVSMFLRHISTTQAAYESRLKEIADKFSSDLKIAREGFQSQVKELYNQFERSQASFRDQLRDLTDKHLSVLNDTVLAVRGLQDSVKELRQSVSEMAKDIHKR